MENLIHEFFLMCNTIFSIVTQPPVNYTSLRSVLQNGIGMNVTLNSIQMAYVINKVKFFRNTARVSQQPSQFHYYRYRILTKLELSEFLHFF